MSPIETQNTPLDPRMTAAIDMVLRTGLNEFRLRFSDDEWPIVWIAVGLWQGPGGVTAREAAAALRPELAVFRLCETVIDGGTCTHCDKPAGFSPDVDALPLDNVVCWYQWDPELLTFRRGCEGSNR